MNSKEKITDKSKKQNNSSKNILFAGSIYLLLVLYLPAALFLNINTAVLQALSIAVTVACAFAFSRLTGSSRPSILLIVVVICALMFLGTVVCGFAAAFIGSICILGYILISCDSTAMRFFAILPAVAAYIVAYLLVGSFVSATVALIHIPAAIMLAYAFNKKLSRISSICHISVGIIIGVAAVAAAWFIKNNGLSLSALISFVDSAKAGLTDILAGGLYTVYNEVAQISMTDARELSFLAVSAIFNLLPAIIVVISNILAFLLHLLTATIILKQNINKVDIRSIVVFDMSLVSAIVFGVAFILTAALSGDISVWSVTAENVMLILMPGFIFIAMGKLRSVMFAKKSSCSGTLAYFAIVLSIFYLPAVTLPVGSIAGAVIVIMNNVTKIKKAKKQ